MEKRIGGWLLFVSILFILAGIGYFIQFFLSIFGAPGIILTIFLKGHARILLAMLIYSAFTLVLALFFSRSTFLILRKDKKAPYNAILTLWLSCFYIVWTMFLSPLIFQFKEFLGFGILFFVWNLFLVAIGLVLPIVLIFYLKKSKRVKNTF